MIVLLDLNFTLVENSHDRRSPFSRQIAVEQYRAWLPPLLVGHTVVLITARPAVYRDLTLQSIHDKLGGWQPDAAYFNTQRLPPPVAKKEMLEKFIWPRFGRFDLIGIESNPATRAMYASQGIVAFTAGFLRLAGTLGAAVARVSSEATQLPSEGKC